ncbi:MAG: glycosyltransferase [Rhodospirillales bacterium]|nr:glycosyltransferase [Rhodospirillales bacterium]
MHGEAADALAASLTLRKIGQDIAIALWETGAGEQTRLHLPTIDGQPAKPPVTRMSLATLWGGQRCLAAFRWAPDATDIAIVDRATQRRAAVAAPVGRAGLRMLDAAALLDGLDADGRIKATRFLLEVCRSTFKLGDDAAFVALCHELVAASAQRPAGLRPRLAVASDLVLCAGLVPDGFGAPSSAVAIGKRAVRQTRYAPAIAGGKTARGHRPVAIMLDRAEAAEGMTIVVFGAHGLAYRRVASGGGPDDPPLPRVLAAGIDPDGRVRDYVLRCLNKQAPGDPAAAAALEEFRLTHAPQRAGGVGTAAAQPRLPVRGALERLIALPATATSPGGLFASGWINDPHGMVAGLALSGSSTQPRPWTGPVHRVPAPDNAKRSLEERRDLFVAYLPSLGDDETPRLSLALRSGASVALANPMPSPSPRLGRDAVLAALPAICVTQAIMQDCMAPAARALQAAHLWTRRPPEIVQFGERPADPRVSILIPLYRNLEFLRFQLAAFAVDPEVRESELIFVLDSPEQRRELEHYLTGLHLLYGLPMTLVVMSDNFGYAAANNAGAAVARGRELLLLNSDVVPDRPGWLGLLADAVEVDEQVGAVGAKLLFDDESLQHAGLYFDQTPEGEWYNRHYFKGFPRDFPAACVAREVPGVTGACLMVRRELYAQVGGLTEDYLIGDYEDSDLCLKLRRDGYVVRYEPAAELYHFERRSIERNSGYTRGAADHHNRWLHHTRWQAAIAALMTSAAEPAPALPLGRKAKRKPAADRKARERVVASWAKRLSNRDPKRQEAAALPALVGAMSAAMAETDQVLP